MPLDPLRPERRSRSVIYFLFIVIFASVAFLASEQRGINKERDKLLAGLLSRVERLEQSADSAKGCPPAYQGLGFSHSTAQTPAPRGGVESAVLSCFYRKPAQ